MKTFLRLVGWTILGLVISEILAWIYLSIFPRDSGVSLEPAADALIIMRNFAMFGLATGFIIGIFSTKSIRK